MTTAIRTSRIGRKPVVIPSGVDVKVQESEITVKGPKGQLSVPLHDFVKVNIEANLLTVAPDESKRKNLTGTDKKLFSSIAGTVRANIGNLVHGVTEGFERKLTLVGVGYRAQAKGKVLGLNLGFSHPTEYAVPEGITIETPQPTEIIVKGASKELVGQVASEIRSIRSPEPYKGKGVRYSDEHVEIKETKKK